MTDEGTTVGEEADDSPYVQVVPTADPEQDDPIVQDYREARIQAHRDPLAEDFQLGDVCIDLATGRAVQIVGLPDQTVAEWSDANDYDLTTNFANERTRVREADPVVECVYVASVQSEPSGPRGSSEGGYTFPSSRLARVPVERVDGVRRPYEAVAVDVLRRLFVDLRPSIEADNAPETVYEWLDVAAGRQFGDDIADLALELADVEQRFGGDDEH